MAEFVQQSIEEMLPELEQMERIELFTNKETRAILKKRKSYEYKLRRRTKEKEDYLQYIQYEMNVLRLVKKRRKRLGCHFKQLEIDTAIINRIHMLFKLACWRFQDDIKLWLSHIEFCKKRKDKSPVGTLFTRMLQIHNKKPGLWVLAAQWEMEISLSMENARGLLQRGLRFNPTSQHLWQEYFRMELLNADKLRKRQEIMGLAGMETDVQEMSDVVLEGKVASVVLQKAMEAVPGNVDFCLSFLPICHLFNFTQSIEQDIFDSLQAQFPSSELALEASALRSLKRALVETKALKSKKERGREIRRCEQLAANEFDKAVTQLNTEKMWSLYLKFCLESLNTRSSPKHSTKKVHHALTVFQRACDIDKLTEQHFFDWAQILLNIGDVSRLESTVKAGVERYPQAAKLWIARIRSLVTVGASTEVIKAVIEEALSKVRDEDSLDLWQLALEWSLLHCPDYTEDILKGGVKKSSCVSCPMKVQYLDWASLNHDIHTVRQLYGQLDSSPPVSIDFFKKYIEIENTQPSPKMKKLRRAYEDAIQDYGSGNIELWLDYIRLETTHPKGQPENVGKIHWRALKALDGSLTERFVAAYTLLQSDKL